MVSDLEFRLGAFRRGQEHEARYMRGRVLRLLREKHWKALHLGAWAQQWELPSDYWDARADVLGQLIVEVEGL